MSKEKLPPLSERRRFLLQALQGLGLATLGALTWSAYLDEASASSLYLRPPGALAEKDFLSHCIRCGLCVEACPYDTLKLARAGDNVPVGTPYFTARMIPCYMCKDIPCVPPCPSGALNESLVTKMAKDGKETLDITQAKMGVAVIDADQCIAFWGIQCDACYRACPLINEAIVIDASRNERTGKHAFMAPRVIGDVCTGCGMCEKACVTEKASIFVLPLAIAKGKAGSNYIKGWDEKDEKRLETQTGGGATTVTPVSDQKAVDYLNSEEF
ncbi:MAG: ferredoxin-type protein NapG [Sulfuricurvum sp.]|nr:ferredoxin-type protein NapG [Sulfuricurvum sp.]